MHFIHCNTSTQHIAQIGARDFVIKNVFYGQNADKSGVLQLSLIYHSSITQDELFALEEKEPILLDKLLIMQKDYLEASSIATATATVAPTMGLLPMPIRPIISTCAGTDELPANCASECMRPMVSVIP